MRGTNNKYGDKRERNEFDAKTDKKRLMLARKKSMFETIRKKLSREERLELADLIISTDQDSGESEQYRVEARCRLL